MTKGVNRRIEALEQLAAAAREYIGERPLELLAQRDAGDALVGLTADPKWVRLVAALARLNATEADQ